MFTLRKITTDGFEMNFVIGKNYGIEYREKNQEEFNKRCSDYIDAHGEEVYGMICDENSEFHCLFKKQQNYIMTENGKTYANVSYLR